LFGGIAYQEHPKARVKVIPPDVLESLGENP
jgi:hypothetical protein